MLIGMLILYLARPVPWDVISFSEDRCSRQDPGWDTAADKQHLPRSSALLLPYLVVDGNLISKSMATERIVELKKVVWRQKRFGLSWQQKATNLYCGGISVAHTITDTLIISIIMYIDHVRKTEFREAIKSPNSVYLVDNFLETN